MNRQEVIDYIQNEFGVEEEHLWMTFPDYIVFRNQKNKKWFAIIMDIEKSKLGLDGVGYNTPVIIKYPFWQYTNENPDAIYVCINKGEADTAKEIADRSICVDGDIDKVIQDLL